MNREDTTNVADELQRILSDEGIQILVAAETLNVNGRSGEAVSLTVRTTSGEREIEGSDILVASKRHCKYRRDRTRRVGVELDARGYIRVNEQLKATTPDVQAMGDARPSTVRARIPRDDFSDHQGQSCRRQPQHVRSAGPLLYVHGPSPSLTHQTKQKTTGGAKVSPSHLAKLLTQTL